jgi:putative membrane protein
MRYLRITALCLLILYAGVSANASFGAVQSIRPIYGNSILWIIFIATALVITHAATSLGWKNTFILFALTYAVSLFFESVGTATGWIYGPYHYTDQLGYRFLGLVPMVIPLAWFMISYPSLLIAKSILGVGALPRRWHTLRVALLAAVVMTAWDLVLDPIMVKMGFWVWEVEGAYFGIPAQNYLGWLVTAFFIFILYQGIAKDTAHRGLKRYDQSFLLLASGAYGSSVAGNLLAALQMGSIGPALIGLFGTGAYALLSLINLNGGPRATDD